MKEQQSKTGELSGDELDNVAGGCNKDEAILSVVSMGFYCAVGAIASAASDSNTIGEDGRILC